MLNLDHHDLEDSHTFVKNLGDLEAQIHRGRLMAQLEVECRSYRAADRKDDARHPCKGSHLIYESISVASFLSLRRTSPATFLPTAQSELLILVPLPSASPQMKNAIVSLGLFPPLSLHLLLSAKKRVSKIKRRR